jgi:hypothetical protein
MLGKTILITFFGLIIGGCASDRKVETIESSGGSSTADGGAAVSSPATSGMVAAEPKSTSPAMSGAAAAESSSMNQSRSTRNRIAAGVEEETLDTCLAGIPEDATAGQKMLAEQTCRRNYASRP